MLNSCHTLDPLSPMSRAPEAFGVEIYYRTFMDLRLLPRKAPSSALPPVGVVKFSLEKSTNEAYRALAAVMAPLTAPRMAAKTKLLRQHSPALAVITHGERNCRGSSPAWR
jgi:hypothetical protein